MTMPSVSSSANVSSTGLGAESGSPIPLAPLPVGQHAGLVGWILGALVLGVVVAVMTLTRDGLELTHPAVLVVSALAGVCLVAAIVGFVRRAATRGQLRVFERGFSVERSSGVLSVPFSDVESIALKEKEALANGRHAGWTRRLAVRTSGSLVTLAHYLKDGQRDEMGAFLGTLIGRVADRLDESLRRGGTLRGQGFTLDGNGLTVGVSGAEPMSRLATVSMFERKVAVFRSGEIEPFFAVKEESENARLLFELLRRRLADRASEVGDAEGLGRVLFKKRSARLFSVVLLIFGVMCLPGGVAMLFSDSQGSGEWVPGALLGLFGAGMLLVGGLALFTRFQAHEKGISRRGLFSKRTLRYAELRGFSHGSVRHYHNGAYVGTQVSMTFTPQQGKPLKFGVRITGNDADLDFLRDRVAQMVAASLYAEVGGGKQVAWGGGAWLSSRELQFNKSRLIGKGESVTLTLRPGLTYQLADGNFLLTDPDTRAVLKIPCSAYNFYPGLILFGRLCEEAGA